MTSCVGLVHPDPGAVVAGLERELNAVELGLGSSLPQARI
jgi:hypothetical protein